MRFLRTNTAVRLTVGPFLDKTDGVTPEVAITVTSCKLTFMVDDANVPTLVLDTAPTASGGANDMVHVTGDDSGFYDLELAAANVNYLGRAMLSLNDAATHCPVFHEFMILPAMIYDSLVLGTDRLDTNVTHMNDVAASAITTIKAVQGLATDGVVPTVTTVTNQLTAAQVATGVWQDTTAGDFTVALSVGKSIMNGVSLGTGLTIARCTLTDTLTTYTGNTPQTGNVYPLVDTEIAAIKAKTDLLPSVAPGSAGGLVFIGTNTGQTKFVGATSGDPGLVITGTGAVGLELNGDTGFADLDAAEIASISSRIGTPSVSVSADIATRSTLTQTQVTGGAYALNSTSFAFGSTVDFTTAMKTSLNNATPAVTVSDKTGFSLVNGSFVTATFGTCDFTSTMKTSLNAATPASVVGAVGSVTGNVGGNVAGSVGTVGGLTLTGLLDLADSIETGLTVRTALRLIAAVLGGKVSGGGTPTETIRNAVADSKDRVVATVDASGNRSAITLDLT